MVGFCIFFVVMYRACQKLINLAVTLFYLDWLYARYQRHLKSEGIRQFCFQNVAHKTTIDHCLTGKLSAVITSNIQKVLILYKCTRISNRTASLSFAYWIIFILFFYSVMFFVIVEPLKTDGGISQRLLAAVIPYTFTCVSNNMTDLYIDSYLHRSF